MRPAGSVIREDKMAEPFNFVQCKPDPNCKGCFYYRGSESIGVKMCMYWDIEDKLRGCPPGKDCTKYTNRKPTVKELRHASLYARRASWDKERGYQLYCKGFFAKTIARECCCSKSSVNAMFAEWRKRAEADGVNRDLNREKRISQSKWDREEGYKLYCQGWTGAEIARHFEVGNITIERAFAVWKQRAAAEGIDHRLAYERRRKARLKNDG